jgi:predicted phosphohydrolase
MKLHIVSYLHTEFVDFTPLATDTDVVVLAGDIGIGLAGIEWAAGNVPDKPVVYIPGNHEYYHHDISLTDDLRAAAPNGVHVLNDDALELGGVRFLGCTLWTDFNLYGEGEAWFGRQRVKSRLKTLT